MTPTPPAGALPALARARADWQTRVTDLGQQAQACADRMRAIAADLDAARDAIVDIDRAMAALPHLPGPGPAPATIVDADRRPDTASPRPATTTTTTDQPRTP